MDDFPLMEVGDSLEEVFHKSSDLSLGELNFPQQLFEFMVEVLHDDVDFVFGGGPGNSVDFHDVRVVDVAED